MLFRAAMFLMAALSLGDPYRKSLNWISQFAYKSPDLFHKDVPIMRAGCIWGEPTPLFEFIKGQVRGNYPMMLVRDKWPGECGQSPQFAELRRSAYVQTCRLVIPNETKIVERILTRIGYGPFLEPFTIRGGETHCLSLVAGSPSASVKQTSFLVESGEAYVHPDGSPIPYPPIHPHHSNSLLVGFQEGMTPATAKELASFVALPIYTIQHFERMPIMPTSMNSLGWNVDRLGCQHITDSAACFFTKFPPGFGVPLHPGIDQWTDVMIDAAPQNVPPTKYVLELYRKWETPKRRSTIQPLWSLDFSIVGSGATYLYPHNFGPAVMWRKWTIPFAGTFMASWYHTDPMVSSEMLVLGANVREKVLPALLWKTCYRSPFRDKYCKELRGASGHGVTEPVPIRELNISIESLMAQVLADGTLRCHFKSNSRQINGQRFGVGGHVAERSVKSCDNWNFDAGTEIALLAFIEQSDLPDNFQNQHRWWPLAKLQLPASFDVFSGN